jgi:hypothetical protein
MPQCQFHVFCNFCVSEKLHRKYSQNWTNRRPKLLFFPDEGRGPKESRRGGQRAGSPWGGAPPSWPRQGVVRPPWWPFDAAPPPIKSLPKENPKTIGISPEQFCSAAAVEDKFRGTKVSVPAPCRTGKWPRSHLHRSPSPSPPSPSTSPPSPSPLLPPMMRRE